MQIAIPSSRSQVIPTVLVLVVDAVDDSTGVTGGHKCGSRSGMMTFRQKLVEVLKEPGVEELVRGTFALVAGN